MHRDKKRETKFGLLLSCLNVLQKSTLKPYSAENSLLTKSIEDLSVP